jgi:hypothetical protein
VRRLIAVLSLFGLANLVFAQGGVPCSLKSHHEQAPPTSAMMGHAHHDLSATAHDVALPMPDENSSHAPVCLATGPCAVTLGMAGTVVSTYVIADPDRLLAASDHLPPSAVVAPELPPPRA